MSVLALLAVPSSALSSARKLHVVASAPGENYPATATATANRIPHPRALYARVTADPKQLLRISYVLRCSKGGATSTEKASWHGMSGTLVRLTLPVARPASCYATAQSGAVVRSMTLQLLAT